ncbi:hypothetical protein H634G_04811 [Metarhizium anisopliae BRIP 53293]|uniref:ER-bound oxygenase mpaB/mpaB'/Rubber oxygenase catalytic domain-containing protein n=1 Tax=Metarhizium anisopliae BRIP 53293 TaxID=1291518 RepID=A0A0D9P2T2_METAN|nr:hypothetical protein H634G_04811 [Metarhizium anisopliae BRIP 53293]KJK95054.1 hypothetical protein H633G_01089 [Metarhizium anisopliae BRIP 53284]
MAVRKNTKGNRKEYYFWGYTFEWTWTDKQIPASEVNSWILKVTPGYQNSGDRSTQSPAGWTGHRPGVAKMFTGDTSYQYPTRASGAIRVGETIARTGRFGATVVRRRLLETLQYTLQVNHNTEGIKSGGEGHLVCVRVRLLHSTVRLEMTSLTAQDPTYYDVQKYGPPIKDVASLGTIHTFSSTVIWQGLPRQGIHLSE